MVAVPIQERRQAFSLGRRVTLLEGDVDALQKTLDEVRKSQRRLVGIGVSILVSVNTALVLEVLRLK